MHATGSARTTAQDRAGGANIVALESLVSVANADLGTLAYITNAVARGKLKQTLVSTSAAHSFVWDGNDRPNGYNAFVSNNVPSNLTKGTSNGILSAIIFGNWNDLLVGMWSGLDLLTDPYTHSTTGTVRVGATQDVDVALRRAGSAPHLATPGGRPHLPPLGSGSTRPSHQQLLPNRRGAVTVFKVRRP